MSKYVIYRVYTNTGRKKKQKTKTLQLVPVYAMHIAMATPFDRSIVVEKKESVQYLLVLEAYSLITAQGQCQRCSK